MDSQVKSEGPSLGRPPRRKRRSTERIWPKRILKPISFFLTTGDETDTVDRLFVSKHVNDLRLIAATVFVTLILVLLLAVAVAISTALVDPSPDGTASEATRLLHSSTAAGGVFLKLFAPTLALFGAVLTWAYQTGNSRLGVVDLFACKIDTLCRVITVVDMVGNLTKNYNVDPSKEVADDKHKAANPARFNHRADHRHSAQRARRLPVAGRAAAA